MLIKGLGARLILRCLDGRIPFLKKLSVSRVKDILKSVQNFYGSTDCIFVLGIEI